jgi:hypothetical protein
MPRRSSRILNRDGKKYDMAVRLLGEGTHSFVSGDFTPLERAIKIRNIYNIIYDSRQLFHVYTTEEFIVKFMKKYIEQGKKILNSGDKKSHTDICRPSIMRATKYAEKYLRNRDFIIKRAAYKIAQKTCTDASKMVVSFL